MATQGRDIAPPGRVRVARNARARIVAAAIDLFHERGYDGTSVQEVVDRAEVTKGAFYYHFESKDDVLLLIHDRFMDEQLKLLDSISTVERPAAEIIAELVEQIVLVAERFQREMRIFYEHHRFMTDAKFAPIWEKRSEFEHRVTRIIQRGVDSEELVPVASARVVAFGIIGMSAWTYHWFQGGQVSSEDVGQQYAEIILRGLAVRPA